MIKTKILIECDSCDDEIFEGKPDEDSDAVIARAKLAGWKMRYIDLSDTLGGEWAHGCPKCGV